MGKVQEVRLRNHARSTITNKIDIPLYRVPNGIPIVSASGQV